MDHKKTFEYLDNEFDTSIIPALSDFIKIDNLSMAYDPEWASNGKLEAAANHLLNWALSKKVKGLKGKVLKLEGLSPLIHLEIESNGGEGNIFMYGHYDKQPHFTGWKEGTGPTTPVIIDGLLYGRGGADDGYAIFSSLISIKAIQDYGLKHGNVNIIIEGSEESGSPHLMQYIDLLKEKIGTPDLLICMDSGCKDYERLWVTTSLRGVVNKDITVECLQESVHSGLGTGQGPDSFTVIRQLLDRVEDSKTSRVIDDFQVVIPGSKYIEAKQVSDILGKGVSLVKLSNGVKYLTEDLIELYLGGTWKATVCVTGQTGLPPHSTAGNVLRNKTSIRLSMRLPPTKNPQEAEERLEEILKKDPPYNSNITIEGSHAGSGWAANDFSSKLRESLTNSSLAYWSKDIQTFGEGGSIPFINSLAQKFPKSEFLVLGVLGPNSNAHAANETLNISYCKKVTACLTHAVFELFHKIK